MRMEKQKSKIEEAVENGDVAAMEQAAEELGMLIKQAMGYKQYLKEEINRRKNNGKRREEKVKEETKDEGNDEKRTSPHLKGGYGLCYEDARQCGFKLNDQVIIRNFVKVP